MRKIVKYDDGTTTVLNTEKDAELYNSPRNPPNTGSRYTSGTDLQVHQTKTHGNQFYLVNWSMWQGTEMTIEAISKEQAIDFLRDNVGDYWGFPDDGDLTTLKEYDIDLMEETA
jgi:hypothetical protein